jgi:hypothetical protein
MRIELTPTTLERLDRQEIFLQSGFWGRFRAELGWTPMPFIVTIRDPVVGFITEYPILALRRRIGRLFSIAYVPYPALCGVSPYRGTTCAEGALFREALDGVSALLAEHLPADCLFIRYDVPWSAEDPSTLPGPDKPFFRSSAEIQPPSTVVLELSSDEDELLARMKPKTRYNIRLAEKKGVEVIEGTERDLDLWYDLYRETSLRDRIALHDREYYRTLFRVHRASGTGGLKLLLARAEGEVIAGIVMLIHENRATYLYGASSNRKRNLMPAYALQWYAIREAKSAGCLSYDMFGIPPDDDPAHPMHGLYRFKTGFGGTVLHRPGCWDYPLKPMIYRAYRAAEAARMLYYKKIAKRARKISPSRETSEE